VSSRRRWIIVWVLACLPLMGWWLYGLFDVDEGFYGAVVAEMNRRGEWITPYYNGKAWFEKPILLYWLAKPCLALFGDMIGPRLPSILTTLGTYGAVAWFANRRLGATVAQLSVLFLASSLLVPSLDGGLAWHRSPVQRTGCADPLCDHCRMDLLEREGTSPRISRLLGTRHRGRGSYHWFVVYPCLPCQRTGVCSEVFGRTKYRKVHRRRCRAHSWRRSKPRSLCSDPVFGHVPLVGVPMESLAQTKPKAE